ncbi:hypothetical protein Prum_053540 [Phytohabitans rumicis]|uniref:DNA ligase D 3'-phosphoesterase domain-containing protein n=1 Tax=Phytohabitans rumicis TaxID=1076125 RepID=A0A6V8L365_9ACTN|nr:hypothetical protein Prum_053540 [Phytohabitans rumicis]
MGDRLDEYRRKRDARRTPEPVPAARPAAQGDDTFVIQQHHARSLHWDLRLERDGVLVSWAVPRGVPRDPARNNLAVQTEDHSLVSIVRTYEDASNPGSGRYVRADQR